MKKVGEVAYCDVLVGKDGRSNGSGLVRFSTVAEAEAAISELTNTELDGRQIFVREDKYFYLRNTLVKNILIFFFLGFSCWYDAEDPGGTTSLKEVVWHLVGDIIFQCF